MSDDEAEYDDEAEDEEEDEEEYRYESDGGGDDDEGDGPHLGASALPTPAPLTRLTSYDIMTAERFAAEQKALIADVCDTLGIEEGIALPLLRHYKWDKVALNTHWFSNQAAVLAAAGLSPADIGEGAPRAPPPALERSASGRGYVCPICCAEQPDEAFFDLGCGHRYCESCWRTTLRERSRTAGNDIVYTGCLFACSCGLGATAAARHQREPHACARVVPAAAMARFLGDADLARYRAHLTAHFVDALPTLAWCPGAGCGLGVRYAKETPGRTIKCSCGTEFCWQCQRPPHTPATCAQVGKWREQQRGSGTDLDDGGTEQFISAHTKKCPNGKCGVMFSMHICQEGCPNPCPNRERPSEGGCNHITCKQCKHEWCWLCQKPWKGHGGSYYHCNVYQGPAGGDGAAAAASSSAGDSQVSELKRQEEERRRVQDEFNRFRFYNERFSHHLMGVRAIVPLREDVEAMKELLREVMSADAWAAVYANGTWFSFLEEGMAALAESRATLQWSYATLFALHRAGGVGKPSPRAPLFETQQGQLENLSVELHKQLTKDFATGRKEHAERLVDAAPKSMDELKFSIVTLTQGIRKFNTALTLQVDEWNDEDEGKPSAR